MKNLLKNLSRPLLILLLASLCNGCLIAQTTNPPGVLFIPQYPGAVLMTNYVVSTNVTPDYTHLYVSGADSNAVNSVYTTNTASTGTANAYTNSAALGFFNTIQGSGNGWSIAPTNAQNIGSVLYTQTVHAGNTNQAVTNVYTFTAYGISPPTNVVFGTNNTVVTNYLVGWFFTNLPPSLTIPQNH